jgi:four helix bundle protein
MGSYRDLLVWQKALDLAEAVYHATRDWPREELYGLTNQARRAAASVPANIAEGQGRSGSKEFLHHLSIAKGSLHELETHLFLAQRLGYGSAAAYAGLLLQSAEVGRMLLGLIRKLRPPATPRE